MKIGLVLADTPGYSETFFISKIKGLQEAGFEVILFVDKQTSSFNLCQVFEAYAIHKGKPIQFVLNCIRILFRLIFIPKQLLKFIILELKADRKLKQIMKNIFMNVHILSKKVDWLHFGFSTLAIHKEHVAKSIDAKMAISLRGFDVNVYPLKHDGCYNLVWSQVDKVHSISNYLVERAVRFGLSEAKPYKIITPAVDMNVLPANSFIPSGELKIITVARFNWIKGLTTSIHAMKLLKNSSFPFEYHIIGSGNEHETERIKYLVVDLGLQDEIVFHGSLSHAKTKELMADSEIYVQPSLSEGFCNATIEAQALGLLCVVSDGGALHENIEEGETGLKFARGDYSQLAELIHELYMMPDSKKNSFIEKSKNRIVSTFGIEDQKQKFIEFYIEK